MIVILELSGCVSRPLSTEKVRDLEYVILEEHEIPEELMEKIEKIRYKAFRSVYEDAGVLYIAQGFGAQLHTGYKVEVTAVYETENAVCFHSRLLGPEKDEEVEEISTFPFVVIKMESLEKDVIFL